MANMSNWLEVEIRKHIFRTGSMTKPTVLAIALCTADPTDASTGATMAEVASANGYARVQLDPADGNWSGASSTDGLTDNVAAITFPVATGAWGTIVAVAILDSITHGAGNILFWGELTLDKTVGSGDTFKFNAGDLDITFA